MEATRPRFRRSEFAPTVLVVDDDREVAFIIEAVLGEAGFAVATASSIRDALRLIESRRFDLMVTDVVLPGELSGLELVVYARIRQPLLKSLFISGAQGPVVDDPDQDDFVAKPFHPGELLGCTLELFLRQRPRKDAVCPRRATERAIVEAKVESFKERVAAG
jgi:DNA-binding response OmpR family regulator